jgi:trimethylamine--corrinoid protein Co-methyltransferase
VIPRIEPPPSVELDAIHEASLRVLERVGVVFPDRRAQRLLADAGADVHADSGLVRIPPRLVEEALAAAPRDILLAGRDSTHDVRCDGSDTFLTLDGTGAYTLDHHSGERRPSTMQDLGDAARVADAAPEVGVVWNIVSASDAPPTTQVLDELAACVRNTGKHVQGEVQRAVEVPYVMEILAAAADDGRWDPARPFFSIVYCPVPPLQHEPEMIAAAVALAGEGVPMCVYSMGLAGATAPVTMAGAVMQANAEILSSIVLFQLVRPGLPCIYVADTGVLDMRAGIYTAASPESILITQAMVGLARRYELPVMATGLTGDANGFSMMSGSDAGMTALATMLMAPDLLVGAGMLDGAQMLSLPKILLDCELFRQCRRVRAGMTVDDDHLMTDVVADVGPGGHFLKAKQTRQHMRSGELYVPELMLREPYEAWSVASHGELERAVAAVDKILAAHRPKPLPAGAVDRIHDVIAAAGSELVGR